MITPDSAAVAVAQGRCGNSMQSEAKNLWIFYLNLGWCWTLPGMAPSGDGEI